MARHEGLIRRSEVVRRRVGRGWSQKDLASAAGVSHGSVSKIESGLTRVAHPSTVHAIAKALDCAVDDIADFVDSSEPARPTDPEAVRA